MRAVIIGAGKLGCGYFCPLLAAAGWEIVLVTRDEAAAERIRKAGAVDIRVTGDSSVQTVAVPTAVRLGSPRFAEAIGGADLVVTAVGVGNAAALGPDLARGLTARDATSPLDIWVVENQDCAPALEAAVRRAAAELGAPLPPVGFAGAVAQVAVARGDWHGIGRPQFCGDSARRLLVDETRLVRSIPSLPGVAGTRHYLARLREKLYVFNAGHALCAYLGALRGHGTVDAVARDPALRPLIAGCLLESRKAVVALHPELGGELNVVVADALRRYGDDELGDPIRRVARDPIRKLAPGDRLLGPAKLIEEASGRPPSHFALGIAAALLYRCDGDAQSRELAEALERRGVMAVLEDVCDLADDDPLADAIANRYHGFILTRSGAVFPPVHEYRERQLAVSV